MRGRSRARPLSSNDGSSSVVVTDRLSEVLASVEVLHVDRRHIVLPVIACFLFVVPAAFPQGRTELGPIAIPQDFDDRTSVLPKGDYGLYLRGEELGLVQKNWRNGLERSFPVATRVEEVPSGTPDAIGVTEVSANGRPHVQIRVVRAGKAYTALLRVSADAGPRPIFKGTIDAAIVRELALLREAHAVLAAYADQIWPGWTGHQDLEFFLTFPSRAVLILSGKPRVPQAFEPLDVPAVGAKRVYIDNTRSLPGPIGAITQVTGRADFDGVFAALGGPMGTAGTSVSTGAPAAGAVPVERGELDRLLTYVHEAFHCLQADHAVQVEKAGRRKDRGRILPVFEVTADYAVYAEIEGEALLKAFLATDRAAAITCLKDSLVARELKQKALPAGAVVADLIRTRAEGTATYANLKAAMLLQSKGRPRSSAADRALDVTYRDLGAYVLSNTSEQMARVKGSMQATDQRYYIYGAYQAMVLDRVFPDWKAGLFENDRTLDDVLAERLALSAADREASATRFASVYRIEEVRGRHAATLKAREDAIQSVRSRQGRTHRIDVSQAQRNVDIRPRPGAIIATGEQLYPHGLEGLTYGSLRLVSKDAPMRLVRQIVEWVDTEPAAGEKGYDLKYEEQAGEIYKKVTVTTKAFTFTANAVRIVDDGKVVTFFIID